MSDCIHCSKTLGASTKTQPTDVVPADHPHGATETWCPRCFIAKRMVEEPLRFNASQTAVIICRACGWESVSFGASPRSALRCNHCGAYAGKKLPLPELPISQRDAKDFVEAAHAAGLSVAVSR
jgi:hypothetical protein